MFAVALIVFRETLEAALILSIVLAASVGIPGRGRWITAGVTGGVIGAMAVAIFANAIAEAFAGSGQELLNATILGLAVCMLAWHNIWMASHAREMMQEAKALGQAVETGARPVVALALITGAAVLREGSETVLFLFSVAASSSENSISFLIGGLVGLACGVALGAGMYFGLLRIPVRRLFAVVSVMLLFLAAGLAAQCVSFLAQADVLPTLGDGLWDTSFLLSEGSIPGRILHTLIGYSARPSGIQLVAWIVTIIAISVPMWSIRRRRNLVVKVAVAIVGLIGLTHPAAAELQVRVPFVEWRELEFEHNGLVTFGPKGSSTDRAQSYTNAIGYGVLPWWEVELEGELASGAGQHLTWAATTIENTFQLTERGKYPVDVGMFVEYSQSTGLPPNDLTIGPLLHKDFSLFGLDTGHTANFLFSREVGGNASKATGFEFAWQSVAYLHPLFSPGFEYYGLINDLSHAGRYNQQQHYLGPVITGFQSFAPYGKLKFEVGYLAGLTTQTSGGAVRWKLEYEIVF